MTNEQILKKIIDKEVKILIDKLKPVVKKKAVFILSDEKVSSSKKITLANINFKFNPPVITIFTKTISRIIKQNLTNSLKEIIAHEILHCFTKKEKEAYQRQNKMNFWL